ncbi:MAG: hypothetical protein PVG39_20880 [Desulfobacteraceae bacterium]
MSRIKLTIGTDPEFALKSKKGYVAAQSANIEGTKHEPFALKNGGTLQRDNVAVEFATDPAKTPKSFVKYIKQCLADTYEMLPEGVDMVAEPSAQFPEEELEHPETQEFGCSADFDAYTKTKNAPPYCSDETLRSFGAHVHVGCLDENGEPIKGLEFLTEFHGKIDVVKAMDLFHGLVSTLFDNSPAAIKRRELYGKAGCHRPTKYGVEYRVLSNFWMKSPELVMLIDSLTRDAVNLVKKKQLGKILEAVGEDNLQNIINNGDTGAAGEILSNHIIPKMSKQTLEYYEMCLEKMPKYKSIKEEWGI